MKMKTSPKTDSMNRSFRKLILTVILSVTLCVAAQVRPGQPHLLTNPLGLPAYPLKASDNGRYLVDQNGTPTILVGDSPHSLFVNLSTQQADTYFGNRASYGINALWIEVLCNTYTAGRPDGSTYDGIIPFTTPGDMSTPNPAYFRRLDQMVRLAANHGIQIVMDDLVLVGLRLSGADGIQLIKDFRSLNPIAAILLLSEHADALLAQRVFRAGARAYLSVEDAPELIRAFDEILAGRPYVGGSVLPLILNSFAGVTKNARSSDIHSLSDRELEIFSFIGRGLSASELATELNVSVKTIETHQMRIKEKLALHSAAELRQKARDWLARSVVNRVHEDPEPA
jgi:DNA-binding NarL/FixJ family response regulator